MITSQSSQNQKAHQSVERDSGEHRIVKAEIERRRVREEEEEKYITVSPLALYICLGLETPVEGRV